MAGSDCADALAAAFRGRGRLSEQEIRIITDEIQRRYAGRQGGLDMRDAEFAKIAREVAASVREAAMQDRRAARLNAGAKQRGLGDGGDVRGVDDDWVG